MSQERWIIDCTPGGGGRVQHHHTVRYRLGKDFDTMPAPESATSPSQGWPGYEVECTINIDFIGTMPGSVSHAQKYIAWLLHGPLPPNIHSLTLGSLEMDLRTLGGICRNQVARGNQPILEISVRHALRFDFEQLSAFGDLAGDRLEKLQLFQTNAVSSRSPVKASDLPRLVDTIKEHFHALLELDIAIAGPIDRDYSPVLADRPFNGKLRRINVRLQRSVFEEGWGYEPIVMLARCLACLGRPGCKYDCTAWDDERGFISLHEYDDALGKLVRYFQQQVIDLPNPTLPGVTRPILPMP